MRIPRLFVEQPLDCNSEIKLDQEQTHYLAHVLRMRRDDKLILFNHDEYEYAARVLELSRRESRLVINGRTAAKRESALEICLGIGISRGQHMDYAIQKAVELGVSRIVPVLSEFSNVKLQRQDNKMAHWRKIIIHASEQCGRTQLAQLELPVSFADYLSEYPAPLQIILQPDAEHTLNSIDDKPDLISLLIGPEGGFSETELLLARDRQFMPIRFGPRILRAETAVVAVVSVCQQRWGDLSE